MLKEAKRLYDLGLAVHWLRPNSKAPVKSGWSAGSRDDWATLRKEYRKDYGLGVRLGAASKLPCGEYLAVIDVDVKSDDPRHQVEAYACVEKHFPSLLKASAVPKVATGRGRGSLHIYVKTLEPVPSRKLGGSGDDVLVYSPTSPVSRAQKETLSSEKIAEGWRLKKAWEVELMSVGKQVVLPPTRHVDTGNAYAWLEPLTATAALPTIAAPAPGAAGVGPRDKLGTLKTPTSRFQPLTVDLVGSPLSDRLVDMVLTGKGVTDRSAALMSVTLGMVSCGFSDDEILSVLTDEETFLGGVAYEHRKTRDRSAAAAWVRDYTLAKARRELSAAAVFAEAVTITPQLSDEAAERQAVEVIGNGDGDWRERLDRGKGTGGLPGPLKGTLKNVIYILEHAVGRCVFKRDAFAQRDTYAMSTPWGGKYGELVTDDDAVAIKFWLARKWNIEPNTNIVFEAISHLLANNSYHPVRDYLNSLPAWDGVVRVDTWLKDYLGAEGPEPYLSDVSRKFLLAAVTRIYKPGAKFDHMLILEGRQGIGKSSLGRIIASEEWFLDGLPDLSDKDAALALRGRWFVEMSELANLRRSEVEMVKGFVTRQVDKVRPPYGRRVVELPRQSVFFGTTNASFYLVDKTGNRRFWPVVVTHQLDFERLAEVRDQLFAEAKWIYENLPEPLYLDGAAAKEQATALQEDKVSEDEESILDDVLTAFIRNQATRPEAERFDFSKFRMTDLFNGFGPFINYRADSAKLHAVGRVLRRAGFSRVHTEHGKRWKKKS